MKKFLVPALVALAAAVAIYGGFAFLNRNSAGLLEPHNGTVVARGEAVYARNCASCHGNNLEGQPDWQTRDEDGFMPAPPHDASGHTWHHPDQLLFNITKLGVVKAANLKDYKTRMPAYDGVLSDDDIIAVLSFIKSRWPTDVQRRHDELNRVYARRTQEVQR
ncbi:c-type cytochrome [Manganibacter manganicus]|uniref:Cytochrome C n=1 Tax=Manganibacter manganicus TaxID=1873176 RepID=A0A1V8RMV6_9HYPH|nr:cytochrome c [Pseudaminobacter manganicus]OQM74520.1 cytochrome C [Pseudaminobacter manganicus]